MRLRLLAVCTVVVAGAVHAEPAPVDQLPTLAGQPVLDRPLTRVPPSVLKAFKQARFILMQSKLQMPTNKSLEGQRKFIQKHVFRVNDLRRLTARIPKDDPTYLLFAEVAQALVVDDFVTRTLAAPALKKLDEAQKKLYLGIVVDALQPIARRAGSSYMRCRRLAKKVGSPMSAWGERCKRRGIALDERLKARLQAKPGQLPRECRQFRSATKIPMYTDLDRPPIVVIKPPRFKPEERKRVYAAFAKHLPKHIEHRVASYDEVAKVLASVRKGKLHESAPVCARPPHVDSALTRRFRNVIVARARPKKPAEHSGWLVEVEFEHLAPPGSSSFPKVLVARTERWNSTSVAAAAARLKPKRSVARIGLAPGTSFGWGFDREVSFFDIAGSQPELREGPSLRSLYEPLKRCATCPAGGCDPDAGPAILDFELSIGRDGRVFAVQLKPRKGSTPVDSKCVRRAFENGAWGCPENGPAVVSGSVCLLH